MWGGPTSRAFANQDPGAYTTIGILYSIPNASGTLPPRPHTWPNHAIIAGSGLDGCSAASDSSCPDAFVSLPDPTVHLPKPCKEPHLESGEVRSDRL